MKKLKKELKKTFELTIFFSVLIFLIIWGLYKPSIIGMVVYEVTEHTKEWDFTDPSEYIYNSSLIQVDGDVQLVLQEEILGITFQNSYGYSGTEDTRIYEKYPSFSYSSNPDSPIKTLEEDYSQRMLIRFNDFIGDDKIPNNAVIVSAILKIYSYDNDDGGLISVYEMKKNWTEGNGYKAINQEGEYGCTWNKAIDYYDGEDVNWSIKGGDGEDDREQTALDTKAIPEGNNWIYFNITDVVQKWVNNEPNYGVIFIADDDEGADNFFGKENSNEQYHPILIVNYTNLYYPDSAVVDTQDFTVSDFGNWDLLTKNENLNEQEINYYYSIDSGNSWNLISDFNLNYINSSTIRLRANLTSNGNSPELNSLSLKYFTSVACEEDWHCADWEPEICPRNETQNRICLDLNECGSEDDKPDVIRNCTFNCVENWVMHTSECGTDNTKFIYYTDEEDCNTINNLPEDNGTILTCDYCLPNFVCVTYNSCNVNIKTKQCNEIVDTNYCYELTGLDSDNNPENLDLHCTEFTSNSTTANDNTSEYNFYYNVNETININLNNSQLFVNLEIINNITNGSISIINYDENIKNETINTGLKYFEINADIDNDNLDSNKIKVYYTNEEINNNNLDEDTLDIYYYNSTNQWQKLNSTLNKTGKYLEVVLDHLSYYGVFGEEIQETPTSGGGGAGGGGSGGYILTPEQKGIMVNKEEETKTYEIDSSIENEIDFVDNNKYRFNIKNKGDGIDKIKLSLDNNAVILSQPIIENFDKDETKELLLVTDPILTRNKQELLIQGFTAKTVEQRIKDILTEFTIMGIVDNNVVVNKTIPLTIRLLLFDKVKKTKILPYNIIFIIFMVAFKISLLVIWKVFHKKKKGIKKSKKGAKKSIIKGNKEIKKIKKRRDKGS